jgi:hypothetical protein
MPQTVNPQPSTTKRHPNVDAPPGTMMLDPATCDDGRGGCYVAYAIQTGPLAPGSAGGVRVRYVSAAIAAVDLSWTREDPNRAPPRLATDEEIAQYHAEGGQP